MASAANILRYAETDNHGPSPRRIYSLGGRKGKKTYITIQADPAETVCPGLHTVQRQEELTLLDWRETGGVR